jgi:hypothetical protein
VFRYFLFFRRVHVSLSCIEQIESTSCPESKGYSIFSIYFVPNPAFNARFQLHGLKRDSVFSRRLFCRWINIQKEYVKCNAENNNTNLEKK